MQAGRTFLLKSFAPDNFTDWKLTFSKNTLPEILLVTRSAWHRVKKPELGEYCTEGAVNVLLILKQPFLPKWALASGNLRKGHRGPCCDCPAEKQIAHRVACNPLLYSPWQE